MNLITSGVSADEPTSYLEENDNIHTRLVKKVMAAAGVPYNFDRTWDPKDDYSGDIAALETAVINYAAVGVPPARQLAAFLHKHDWIWDDDLTNSVSDFLAELIHSTTLNPTSLFLLIIQLSQSDVRGLRFAATAFLYSALGCVVSLAEDEVPQEAGHLQAILSIAYHEVVLPRVRDVDQYIRQATLHALGKWMLLQPQWCLNRERIDLIGLFIADPTTGARLQALKSLRNLADAHAFAPDLAYLYDVFSAKICEVALADASAQVRAQAVSVLVAMSDHGYFTFENSYDLVMEIFNCSPYSSDVVSQSLCHLLWSLCSRNDIPDNAQVQISRTTHTIIELAKFLAKVEAPNLGKAGPLLLRAATAGSGAETSWVTVGQILLDQTIEHTDTEPVVQLIEIMVAWARIAVKASPIGTTEKLLEHTPELLQRYAVEDRCLAGIIQLVPLISVEAAETKGREDAYYQVITKWMDIVTSFQSDEMFGATVDVFRRLPALTPGLRQVLLNNLTQLESQQDMPKPEPGTSSGSEPSVGTWRRNLVFMIELWLDQDTLRPEKYVAEVQASYWLWKQKIGHLPLARLADMLVAEMRVLQSLNDDLLYEVLLALGRNAVTTPQTRPPDPIEFPCFNDFLGRKIRLVNFGARMEQFWAESDVRYFAQLLCGLVELNVLHAGCLDSLRLIVEDIPGLNKILETRFR